MVTCDAPERGVRRSGSAAGAVCPAAAEALEGRLLLAGTSLYADFDLEYLYQAGDGAVSLAASTQTVAPLWSMELWNTQPAAYDWQIGSLTFQAPFALTSLHPAGSTQAGFDYSWNDLTLGPGQSFRATAAQQSETASVRIPLSVTRSFVGNEITGQGDLTTTVMVIPEAGLDGGFEAEIGLYAVEGQDGWFGTDPFATLAHVSATYNSGTVTLDDTALFHEYLWSVPQVQAGHMYVFSCTVQVNLNDGVEWARLEPLVKVSARKAADAGTEQWVNNVLNLPNGGAVTIDSLGLVDEANPARHLPLYSVTLPFYGATGQAPAAGPFDQTSDVFTNVYLGLRLVGDQYTLVGKADFDGLYRTYALTARETVLGVDCLVLSIDGFGEDPAVQYYDLRLAEDASGNLRVLKLTGVDATAAAVSWQAGSAGEALTLLPAQPAGGQQLGWLSGESYWVDETGQSVPQLSTGLGPYSNCAVLGWTDEVQERYAWHAPNTGIVLEEWYDADGALLGRWERSALAPAQVDWTGIWQVSGYDMEASTGYTNASSTQTPDTATLTITRRADGLYLADPGDPDYAMLLSADGYALSGERTGYDQNGNYFESYIRMMEIAPGVAVFLYAEGGYAAAGNWWGSSYAGLAARYDWTPTNRPWFGEYDLIEFEVEVNGGGGTWKTIDRENTPALRLGYLGGGQYAAWDLNNLNAPAPVYVQWGNRLLRNTMDDDGQGNYVHWYGTFYQGPDDTLYYLGHESGFEGPMRRDLWWASFYVGVAYPRPGSEWAADLTGEVDMRYTPPVALRGDTFKVPIRVVNRGRGPAVGKADLQVYLSADKNLSGEDVLIGTLNDQSVSILGGTSRIYNVNVVIPDALTYGNYYLLAAIDADDAIEELDETNNVAASDRTFEVAEPRRDLVGAYGQVTLGDIVVPGDRGSISVVVTNQGNIPIAGRIDVSFYLSSDRQVQPGTDVLLTTLAGQAINLAAGASRTFTAKVAIPADAPSGNYYVLAFIDASNAVEEVNEANNVVATDTARELAWRFGTLGGRRNVRLTVLDAAGTPVTFSLAGAGWGEVVGGSDFTRVEVRDSTARDSVRITPAKGARTSLGEVHLYDDLGQFVAPAADLRAGFTADWSVRKLSLGDLKGGNLIEINVMGHFVTPDHSIAVSLGEVIDSGLDTHDVPISSLTVQQWVNGGGPAIALTAPWIGKLSATGRKANLKAGVTVLKGDLQAGLALTGRQLQPGRDVLGSAVVAGVAGGNWDIRGKCGTIRAAATDASWFLDVQGPAAGVDVRGNLAGRMKAWYFPRIAVRGELSAAIVAVAAEERTGTSIGALTAGVVKDLSLDLPGGVTSVAVAEWANTDGTADEFRAGWLGKLTAAGHFQANLTLTGQGLLVGRPALGSATIGGAVSNAAWQVSGTSGAVTVRGDSSDWTASFASLKSLTAGDLLNVSLTVADALGSVKAVRWAGGKLDADSLGTLNIAGRRGASALPGDFRAALTIHGEHVTRGPAVSSAKIAGDLAGGLWNIVGDLGSLSVGGKASGVTVRTTGSMGSLTFLETQDCYFLAGIQPTVDQNASARADFADTEAVIRSITVRGRKLPAGDPTRFVINTRFSAASILSLSVVNPNGGAACGVYVLDSDGTGLRAITLRDTLDNTSFSWRSNGNALPNLPTLMTFQAIGA